MKKLSLMFAGIGLLGFSVWGIIDPPKVQNTFITAPPVERAPQIDGIINPEEWKNAIKLSGGGFGEVQDPRELSLWISYDRSNFYFAVRSALPPGGKLVTKAREKFEVWKDDSVEIDILPPSGSVSDPWIYQFCFNSSGFIYGQRTMPRVRDVVWIPSVTQKHRLTSDGFWETEIALPLSSMDIKEMPMPSQWKFIAARNFKQPPKQAAITASRDFVEKEWMAVLNCDNDVPVVQVSNPDWKNSFARNTDVRLYNPANIPVKLQMALEYSPYGDLPKYSDVILNPGEDKCFSVTSGTRPDEKYSIRIRIDKDGKPLFFRETCYEPIKGKIWNNLDSSLKFKLDFENGGLSASLGTVCNPLTSVGKPEIITSQDGKGKSLALPKDSYIMYSSQNLSIPGAVYFKFKSMKDLAPGEDRKLFVTARQKQGLLYLEERNDKLLLVMDKFDNTPNTIIKWNKPQDFGKDWTTIFMNFEQSSTSLFINGTFAGRINFDSVLAPDVFGDFYLGYTYGVNNYQIDDVRIYDRNLSGEERANILGGNVNTILGKLKYLPTLKELVLDAELESAPLQNSEMHVLVRTMASPPAELLRAPVDIKSDLLKLDKGNYLIRKRIALPEMKDGEYYCCLSVRPPPDSGLGTSECLGREFIVKKYEWENNTIGMSRIVIPPFTPLTVDSDCISAILRKYSIGEDGFPRQITALDDEILAAPITCSLVSGGKEQSFKHQGVKFLEKSGDIVKYSAHSENDLLSLDIIGAMEYDGFLKLTIKLCPKKTDIPLDLMYLDMPIRKDIAKLFHVCTTYNPKNDAGFIPPGEGVVWRSISTDPENFVPYVWIGEEEKGLCYAADSDKGWKITDKKDAVEIIRENDGDVILRLNLIDSAILAGEREIVISLLATPVKPMPKGWQGWSESYSIFACPGNRFLQLIETPAYFGGFFDCIGYYPAFQDYTIIDKLMETRKTGVADQAFIDSFNQRIINAPLNDVPLKGRIADNVIKVSIECGFNRFKGLSSQPPDKTLPYAYTCASEPGRTLPEYKVYKDEWEFCEGEKTTLVKSFSDYALFYSKKLIEHGFEGLYLDQTYLSPQQMWPTGDGYIDETGKVKKSMGVWRMREHVKRLAVMFAEMGKDPFVYIHQTHANYLTSFSFATATVGFEEKTGDTEWSDRWSHDFIRSVNLGRQGGFYPAALAGIKVPKEKKELSVWLTRTMLAALLPHEIQPFHYNDGTDIPTLQKIQTIIWNFGKAEPDTKFIPYWEKNTPVHESDENLLTSAYLRGNKMLLIVGNYGNDADVPISIDVKKIDFKKILSVQNAETGEKLLIKGDNTFSLPIKKHDLALIEIIFE